MVDLLKDSEDQMVDLLKDSNSKMEDIIKIMGKNHFESDIEQELRNYCSSAIQRAIEKKLRWITATCILKKTKIDIP